MARNILSNSNSRTCGALFARSFKFSTFSRSSGCVVLTRGKTEERLMQLLCTIATSFSIRAFFVSGNRCFSCVLQNAPCRLPDVDHRIEFRGRIAVRTIGNKLKSFCFFRKSRLHGDQYSHGERQGVVGA